MTKAEFKKGAKMERFQRAVENPKAALTQIGAFMVSESQAAFKVGNQALGDKKWAPRAPVNVFGILADFAAGKATPPNKRFQTTPALMDTGRLRGSIAFSVSGNTVTVGSNLPYAAKHHFGLETESEVITEEMQLLMGAWLLKVEDDAIFNRLAFLLNKKWRGKSLTMKLPERPIVGITKQTIADVNEAIGVEIFEVR